MACEPETTTVPVEYFVDVELSGVTAPQTFGPVHCADYAQQLLLALAARSNVIKATLRKEPS